MQSELISKTVDFVKQTLAQNESAHDWFHIERVWKNAQLIAKEETKSGQKLDTLTVELAALLHDIADYKLHGGDEYIGGRVAAEWLESQNAPQELLKHVKEIIDNISFKGKNQEKPLATIEARIVRDADRLDAMGAIGIARCFAFGGAKNRLIYDPDQDANPEKTRAEYIKGEPSSIHHFYEKLLFLKDLMTTETGKRLAKQRHQFMQDFLEQFFAEYNA